MPKLIQLNTLSGFLNITLEFFRNQNADILHLQEMVSSPQGRSDFFDFLQLIEQTELWDHNFFSATHDYRFNDMDVYFGNAIFSRYPFLKKNQEFTYLEYKKSFDTKVDEDLPKLFQHTVVEINGKEVDLINYHGHNVRKTQKRGNDETAKHCLRIAEYIKTLKNPVIVSGDFNLAPDSLSLAPINTLLRNLCIENNVQTTRNEIAPSQILVDYIWVSSNITVKHFEVLPNIVSDHAALLLEFDVK